MNTPEPKIGGAIACMHMDCRSAQRIIVFVSTSCILKIVGLYSVFIRETGAGYCDGLYFWQQEQQSWLAGGRTGPWKKPLDSGTAARKSIPVY